MTEEIVDPPPTSPRKFVFVLMPFSDEFEDVYKVGIKLACRDAGAYCERVDEQIFHESILDRVYNQIAKADLIIADMTGRNPNVFYEVGYAHALNKRVILLTQNADDIPFDLKHYPHIVYGGSVANLKEELERRLSVHLDEELDKNSIFENVEIFINGQKFSGERLSISDAFIPTLGSQIIKYEEYKVTKKEQEYFDVQNYMEIEIHLNNKGRKILKFEEMRMLLFSDCSFDYYLRMDVEPREGQSKKIPTGEHLLHLPVTGFIFPEEWQSFQIQIPIEWDETNRIIKNYNLKIVSDHESLDIPMQFDYSVDLDALKSLRLKYPRAILYGSLSNVVSD